MIKTRAGFCAHRDDEYEGKRERTIMKTISANMESTEQSLSDGGDSSWFAVMDGESFIT